MSILALSPLDSEFLFEIMNIQAARDECRVVHDVLMERDIRLNAIDDHFRQGDTHARQSYVPRIAVSN